MSEPAILLANPSASIDLPAELVRIGANPRVTVRRAGPPRPGACSVVYWMQRAQRIVDNPALDVAIEAANALGLPVVVYFSVIPNYPNANLRHYYFMQQGLCDAAQDAAGRGVGFVVRVPPDNSLEAFLEEIRLRSSLAMKTPAASRNAGGGFWPGASNSLSGPSMPMSWFPRLLQPRFRALPSFPPAPQRAVAQLSRFSRSPRAADSFQPSKPLPTWPLDHEITAGFRSLDRTVQPVDSFTGGTHAAMRRLSEFVRDDLVRYDEARNHPEMDGDQPSLALSALWPHRPAHHRAGRGRGAAKGRVSAAIKTRFLEQADRLARAFSPLRSPRAQLRQLGVRRAVGPQNPHRTRRRPAPLALRLRRAGARQTHDELWNAAQRQMVETGWMHNYMRMYWAKKILEWAPEPATAFDWAVTLNDRFELDGRDPNGYAGIAWAIVGRHDRPWFNRPVFGLVRPMTGTSMSKKFDAAAYIGSLGEKAGKLPL